MIDYNFIFNLKNRKVEREDPSPDCSIKYYNTNSGKMVVIGDGYRHEKIIKRRYWNRILKIIKNKELDGSGIEAITKGLMYDCLPEEYENNLISAIKSGVI